MAKQLRPLMIASSIFGFGMGGFFDGIVLHQLLQWHHLVSAIVPDTTVEGLQLNTLWDGIFHSAMYLITGIGLILIWRVLRGSGREAVLISPRLLLGGTLVGWGSFHLFDSIINHWILGIHHIRSGPNELAYDLAFFAVGILLIILGVILVRLVRV